jgi:large subunit ribosomal protein L13e
VFPRKAGKAKKGDASADEVKKAKSGEGIVEQVKSVLPIKNVVEVKEVKVADEEGEENAYRKLRIARSDARLVGVREKRAKAKEEEEQAKKK